jgi:hypothetical protein
MAGLTDAMRERMESAVDFSLNSLSKRKSPAYYSHYSNAVCLLRKAAKNNLIIIAN